MQVLCGLARNGNGIAAAMLAYQVIGHAHATAGQYGYQVTGNPPVVDTGGYPVTGDKDFSWCYMALNKNPVSFEDSGLFCFSVEENGAKLLCVNVAERTAEAGLLSNSL